MLDEAKGCALLKQQFQQAGFSIQEGYAVEAGGRTVHLDGYDPERRVGYEFVTTEAGDREEITPAVLEALEEQADRGQAFVLLIDELDVDDPETLAQAAARFLAEVGRRRG